MSDDELLDHVGEINLSLLIIIELNHAIGRYVYVRAEPPTKSTQLISLYHSTAGSETTAQTLSYAIWELARRQELQDQLRAEISGFGSDEPTYEDLHGKLPFLDAVLRET